MRQNPEVLFETPLGKQTVVTDAMEAAREEAADEVVRVS